MFLKVVVFFLCVGYNEEHTHFQVICKRLIPSSSLPCRQIRIMKVLKLLRKHVAKHVAKLFYFLLEMHFLTLQQDCDEDFMIFYFGAFFCCFWGTCTILIFSLLSSFSFFSAFLFSLPSTLCIGLKKFWSLSMTNPGKETLIIMAYFTTNFVPKTDHVFFSSFDSLSQNAVDI